MRRRNHDWRRHTNLRFVCEENPMSDPAKRFLRVVLGLVLGLVGGTVVGFCLDILLLVVCTAAGADYYNNRPTKPEWVGMIAIFGAYVVSPLAPLAGCVVGVIWAIRRNRR